MNRIVVIVICFIMAAAVGQAQDLLDEAVSKITGAPSVTTRFEVSDPTGKVSGNAVIAGQRFIISTDNGEFETWFDGKTQWTFNAAADEVSMTEPTQQEIIEVNPLSIISSLDKNFKVSDSGSGKYLLTPLKTNELDIKEATVLIDQTTFWPVLINALLNDGTNFSVKFSGTKTIDAVPADKFRYKTSYHPGAEIIDLR